METIHFPNYWLSDEFLTQAAEKLTLDSSGPNVVRKGHPENAPVVDLDAALNEVRSHESQFGLSTVPTVWILDQLRPRPSVLNANVSARVQADSFLLVRFGVQMEPQGGEKFSKFSFTVDFDLESHAFTFDQLPNTTLEPRIQAGVKGDFRVSSDFKFNLISPVDLGKEAKAGAGVEARADAFLAINIDFEWKVSKIISTGIDTPQARWFITTGDLIGFMPLYVILRRIQKKDAIKCSIVSEYTIKKPGKFKWLRIFNDCVSYQTDRIPLNLSIP